MREWPNKGVDCGGSFRMLPKALGEAREGGERQGLLGSVCYALRKPVTVSSRQGLGLWAPLSSQLCLPSLRVLLLQVCITA